MSNRKKVQKPKKSFRLIKALRKSEKLDKIKPFLRYHGYKCDFCAGIFIAAELDEGTVPKESECFITEPCMGRATLFTLNAGAPIEGIPILIEYFRPSNDEVEQLPDNIADSIRSGWLARRSTKEAPTWVKKLAT